MPFPARARLTAFVAEVLKGIRVKSIFLGRIVPHRSAKQPP
jgi:hypothetical protein